MKSYSQNYEDLKVLEYFKGEVGTLLELGANDGTTLSNSRLLIENNWSASLIEPSSVFEQLAELHHDNHRVECIKVGVGTENGKVKFYESANHVANGTDKALVSTISAKELKRWDKVKFEEKEIDIVDFATLLTMTSYKTFDFISIDIEGLDILVLKQINLKKLGCKCLCIEHNGDNNVLNQIIEYCRPFGLYEMHRNAENIILCS